MIPTTFYCGHIDNCAATMKIHLSEYEHDGGPRLIIKYEGDQNYDQADDNEGIFELWKKYMRNLCKDLSEREIEGLRSEILGHAISVANASGGTLGLGKICPEEKKVLKEIEKGFLKTDK